MSDGFGRRWLIGGIAFVLVAAGIVVAVAAIDGDDRSVVPAAGGPFSPDPVAVAPPLSPSPSPSPSSTAPVPSPTPSELPGCIGGVAIVPIYYVGQANALDATGFRLYRDYQGFGMCSQEDAIARAVNFLAVAPRDADYTTTWAEGAHVLSVGRSGDLATIDMSRFTLGDGGGAAAVAQLVWTVTAVDHAVKRVQILVQGKPIPTEYGDWTAPQVRGDPLDVLAHVWLINPGNGSASISSVPVHVRVYGTGYEGDVRVKIYRHGALVEEASITTAMGSFAKGKVNIRLPRGTYEIRAYSAEGDGTELTLWDTKTFEVG